MIICLHDTYDIYLCHNLWDFNGLNGQPHGAPDQSVPEVEGEAAGRDLPAGHQGIQLVSSAEGLASNLGYTEIDQMITYFIVYIYAIECYVHI